MNLEQIKNNLLAGKKSFEISESESFISDLIKELERFECSLSYEVCNLWSEIFIALISSGFLDNFLDNLRSDSFKNFLQKLLSSNYSNEKVQKVIHETLNIIRFPKFLQKIYGQKEWEEIVLNLIKSSNYSFNHVVSQRIRDYPNKNLFHVKKSSVYRPISWNDFGVLLDEYFRLLKHILPNKDKHEIHFAFLLENSLEMATLDICCLINNYVNVMIPANSVPSHVEYILNQTKAPIVFVNDEKQLEKIKQTKSSLQYLEKAILLNGTSTENYVFEFAKEIELSKSLKRESKKQNNADVNNIATIMYTSGTTGLPKGIVFSHLNLIYKRFCRAMAIPWIGNEDRFLAYLPLYHTFGRYLEMMGSIFWAAEYLFLEDPSIQSLINSFKSYHPTIFISVPKKWLQIYETITQNIDIESDSDEKIFQYVQEITGGKLKWGLSAAGFLPPEVFIFFQKNKIELMSGFGMTEATGGITMTQPFRYKTNSLGKSLPGIEIKIAEDGELLIRGAYVMKGYFNENNDETFIDGWLPTGDLMKMDDEGAIEIVDRKKEIYKNNRGETIAPQKIENLFNDFETIKQVFLIGDHRPFNTVLIFPNYEQQKIDLKNFSEEKLYEYFSSMIVTINNFLSPFERIVDFRIIEREFSREHDELTPKGTYKRKIIENHFANIIEQMYEKTNLEITIENFLIKIPNWFLREKGCLNKDVVFENNSLIFIKSNDRITFKILDEEKKIFQLGSFSYRTVEKIIDLQTILINPEYWLGNYEVVKFTNQLIFQWVRQKNAKHDINFYEILNRNFNENYSENYLNEINLKSLNYAVQNLISVTNADDDDSIKILEKIISQPNSNLYPIAISILKRFNFFYSLNTIRKLFLLLAKNLSELDYNLFCERYIENIPSLLDSSTIKELLKVSPKQYLLENFIRLLKKNIDTCPENFDETLVPFSLINFVVEFTVIHPSNYERVRQILVDLELNSNQQKVSEYAKKSRADLRKKFRSLLGENLSVAIDSETGEDYYWENVVTFDSNVDADEQELIFNCISNTIAMKEAVFLFSKGKVVNLDNIMIGGVWITKEREYYNKKIFRVSIHTRYFGSFELVLNLQKNKNKEAIEREIKYLILAGSRHYIQELVEDFGGFWDEYSLWTSKYIPGDTLDKYFIKQTKKLTVETQKRLYHLWPFFVWNAAAAYFNFWRLSNYKSILSYPSPDNYIIPPHDYQTGTKIISLSESFDFKSYTDLFQNFYTNFVESSENKYPFLKRNKIWSFIAAGLVNTEGIQNAKKIIREYLKELQQKISFEDYWSILDQIISFLSALDKGEFLPKQLYFAIKRYRRWIEINPEADYEAKFGMFQEMLDTYDIQKIEKEFPASRLILFYETLLWKSKNELKQKIKDLISDIKSGNSPKGYEIEVLSSLSSLIELSEEEKYFIARFTFPHIREATSAEIVGINYEGKFTTNLVVQYEDEEGNPFFIRKPLSPKEISRLHQLFIEANLTVNFRTEHDYLVAVSERGFVLGGIFYFKQSDILVHMEKIVVAERYGRKGIGEKLMNEFFDRMKSLGIKFITTGFFRPEYFYKFGFKVAKKYSGLVKEV